MDRLSPNTLGRIFVCCVLLQPVLRADEPVAELERLGGTVFRRDGRVVEVNLNRSRIGDDSLRLLKGFPTLTDLSLEQTAIGDSGLQHLAGLSELQWLNLYRT